MATKEEVISAIRLVYAEITERVERMKAQNNGTLEPMLANAVSEADHLIAHLEIFRLSQLEHLAIGVERLLHEIRSIDQVMSIVLGRLTKGQAPSPES